MGLKRRGPGRKQVLDLSDKADSPRRSWQSKYQQICVEHNTQDGSSPETTASVVTRKVTSNNPLSGLIANYNSDSDADDDDVDAEGDLNSKVSDFLKEIQTIVPSGSSIVIPGQPLTTPGLGPEEMLSQPHQTSAITSAWQQCYDETTGYAYYWNMETNAVTWETPADYLADPAPTSDVSAVAQWAHAPYPTMVPSPGQAPAPQPAQQSVARNKAGRRVTQKQVPIANKTAKGRPKSDSEDERIEMITSFGESSEESDEEIKPPSKKKKSLSENHSLAAEQIGPQLQLSTVDPEPLDERSSLFSPHVDDLGPPGVEPEPRVEEPVPSDAGGQETKDLESDPLIQTSDATPTPVDSDDGESLETDEGAILSQLRTQALLLEELGGDLPDEVRQLIEPIPEERDENGPEERDENRPEEQIENGLEERGDVPKEAPDEQTDFEKELEQMERELLEITNAAKKTASEEASKNVEQLSVEQSASIEQSTSIEQAVTIDQPANVELAASVDYPVSSSKPTSVENSPKPMSFALIAGYGDDSDQEEETDKPLGVEVTPPVVKRTFESLPTVPVKTLFPIFEESVVNIHPIVDTAACNVETSEPSHPVQFKPPAEEFAISALRLDETREPAPERDVLPVASMVDTSMPVKAGKRKKRLDISTSADLVAKAAQALAVSEMLTVGEPVECSTEASEAGLEERGSFVMSEERPSKRIKERQPSIEEKIAAEALNEESRKQVEDLAQLIVEKVEFLGEGKEPVPPVQVMAIQIEMLVSAWHKRALTQSYLSDWLGKTWEELRRLESAAAPDGWACQWDRTHKRYYYYNISSGETRWEYPVPDGEVMPEEEPEKREDEPEKKEDEPPVEEEVAVAEVEAIEADIAGGEQAMEICSTPPPSPPPEPSPPPPPKTPPPPNITQRDPSPPPPPRISPFPPPKKGKRRNSGGVHRAKHTKGSTPRKQPPPSDPPLPPPPLPPLPPPLQPPPPPSEPPPLPSTPPPPLPTPPPRLAYGEPLPPGVDPVDLPFAPLQETDQMMPMPVPVPMQAYMMPAYQQPMVPAVSMGAPMMDYGAMQYGMQHTHMSVPAVIAKPPAKKHKAALHAALDSFYSDLAAIAPPTPVEPPQPVEPPTPVEEPPRPVEVPVAVRRKKAKKSAPGLGLKKKGVSSLVAKWQQVQQDVRRDYQTMGEGDGDDSQ